MCYPGYSEMQTPRQNRLGKDFIRGNACGQRWEGSLGKLGEPGLVPGKDREGRNDDFFFF